MCELWWSSTHVVAGQQTCVAGTVRRTFKLLAMHSTKHTQTVPAVEQCVGFHGESLELCARQVVWRGGQLGGVVASQGCKVLLEGLCV